MNREPVRSSDLASVGYDSETSTLEVAFRSGGIYQYFNVPERHFQALTSGRGSAGRYMNANVRGNYRYRRIS